MSPDSSENNNYLTLASLGQFYALNIHFDTQMLMEELSALQDQWRTYNSSKHEFKREGLSLFSLNGETDGCIDLNSILEYNTQHGTSYDELSFSTPTKNWSALQSLSKPFQKIQSQFGRSHLLRFQKGGFFPPHRDLGNAVRLIAFFKCSPGSLYFTMDNQLIEFQPGKLYFANTRKKHCIFNFKDGAMILVINLKASDESKDFILQNLGEN